MSLIKWSIIYWLCHSLVIQALLAPLVAFTYLCNNWTMYSNWCMHCYYCLVHYTVLFHSQGSYYKIGVTSPDKAGRCVMVASYPVHGNLLQLEWDPIKVMFAKVNVCIGCRLPWPLIWILPLILSFPSIFTVVLLILNIIPKSWSILAYPCK